MVLEGLLLLEHLPATGRYSIVDRNAKDVSYWEEEMCLQKYGGETFR